MSFDLERCMKEDGGRCIIKDGRAARVACSDMKYGGGEYPLLVLARHEDGNETAHPYKTTGEPFMNYHDEKAMERCQLLNLPRKLKGYLILWRGENGEVKAMGDESLGHIEGAKARLQMRGCKSVIVPVEADEPA